MPIRLTAMRCQTRKTGSTRHDPPLALSPESHKLHFLRSRAEDLAPAPVATWPRDDKFSRQCFELLRQAYVNARYSPRYEIGADELAWLGERVGVLQTLVESVCLDRLNSPVSEAAVRK